MFDRVMQIYNNLSPSAIIRYKNNFKNNIYAHHLTLTKMPES